MRWNSAELVSSEVRQDIIVGEEQTGLWVAPPNTTVSRLTIGRTELSDSGHYTCAPNLATADTVKLFVSTGGAAPVTLIIN